MNNLRTTNIFRWHTMNNLRTTNIEKLGSFPFTQTIVENIPDLLNCENVSYTNVSSLGRNGYFFNHLAIDICESYGLDYDKIYSVDFRALYPKFEIPYLGKKYYSYYYYGDVANDWHPDGLHCDYMLIINGGFDVPTTEFMVFPTEGGSCLLPKYWEDYTRSFADAYEIDINTFCEGLESRVTDQNVENIYRPNVDEVIRCPISALHRSPVVDSKSDNPRLFMRIGMLD